VPSLTRTLIIGSGPAAAGAVLALAEDPTQHITVLDVGHRLEDDQASAVSRLARADPTAWAHDDVELIRMQPADRNVRGVPEKRTYGSDFPFYDAGQLEGVHATGQVNDAVISGAYGGLSNVWGAQVMVFTPATFSQWPVDASEMEGHYRAVLDAIPYAGEEDALAQRFPLVGRATPLPELAPRTKMVVKAAERHQSTLEDMGVLVGRARLALDAPACVRCGLCMTGCPYSLIYSSAHTFDRFRQAGRIEYHDGLLAFEVGQSGDAPYAMARDLKTGTVHRFDADRVFVASGALGTTRLVLSSLRLFDQEIELAESVQFVMPMVSARPTPDPRQATEFTLNQFNMAIATDEEWRDVAQIHFYPYNPAMLGGLPAVLRSGRGAWLGTRVLQHITVGLGYLPSWVSPAIRATAHAPSGSGRLPDLELSGDVVRAGGNAMFRRVAAKVLRSAPSLDLWPVLPMTYFSAGAKSYHFGGSFPHRTSPTDGPLTTDRLGRLETWSRVHLVDASVFPSVPATTFTLTIMANAHRIADETLRLSP
jgi:choline dehydrogenase-like flavoprotein